ncbi:alkaline phosphatase family protein [Natrononativus amylolyticus]|uniref:alkaline phosphatase family protein n=1 Tax=Natrononativus amylolyticus TaxID=2963434 RepID=UPI0020CC76E4|nr:alkaline phosphatase family protein [Natrononativus amylolyticus]
MTADDYELDTLIIGIDAGCLNVFEPLSDDGVIPTISALCEDGVAAPLESQIPPWTPSAWPSIYTGVNPGKHGACGFVDFDGYDWSVVSADAVQERSMWSLLDEQGLSSVVVNVPVTHPPEEIDGAIVPGFIGPENPTCYPEGTLEELREQLGEYRVYPSYTRGDDSLSDDDKITEYCNLVRMRGAAFSYLVDKHRPDFGFVQFQKTDTVFHEFEGNWDHVTRVYEETDDQIAKILERTNPKRVFIVSDHGIGEYGDYEFRTNEYLREHGFVELTNSGKGMPSWNPIRNDLREGKDVDSWEPSRTERLAAGAARFGLTASRVRRGLEKVGLAELVIRYAPENVTRTANKQVDFENSLAYMRSRTELGVRINLEGREPNGKVPRAEYDDVRAELIECLRAAELPTGEPVFDEVAPREKYFEGPFTEKAIDIVTIPNDFNVFLSNRLLDGFFGPPTEPWNHKMQGVFVASGEGIDTAADLTGATLFDVAPTVFSALGVKYSDRMDGRVLPVVDDVGAKGYREYDEANDEVSTPEDAVEDRLADLGYLD